jgi:ankyrin repeat protein
MMSECDQQALDKVKTLVAAGANIHAKDKEGKTAQDLAQEADYPQTAAFLQQSAKK